MLSVFMSLGERYPDIAGLKLEFGSYNIVSNIYINSDQNSINISDVKTICYTALFG